SQVPPMVHHQRAVGSRDIQRAPPCEVDMGRRRRPTKEQRPSERSGYRQEEDRVRLALGQGEQVLSQLARRLPLCPLSTPHELPSQPRQQLRGLPKALTQLTGACIRLSHF